MICGACLLLAAISAGSDDVAPVVSDESRRFDSDRAAKTTHTDSELPDHSIPSSLTRSKVEDTLEQDAASSPVETESTHTSDTLTATKVERESPKLDRKTDAATSTGDVEPITLDELLRQIRETPHLQREALLTRLAERRRLAIALRTTLEAAEHVAAFGQAGAELLQDASLDAVVATMIEAEEQERRGQETNEDKTTSTDRSDTRPSRSESPHEQNVAKGSAFDTWRPVYIVRDARGQRIGWRNQESQERKVTYVGEYWNIGDDTVSVVAVAVDQNGRYLVVEVNGETREVHLF